MKKLTTKFTESFLKGNNTNLKNLLMESLYVSVQVAK